MKSSSFSTKFCIFCKISLLPSLFVLLFSSLLVFTAPPQATAEYIELPRNANILYMMEDDALKLNGTIVNVRKWKSADNKIFTKNYFEPLIITIDVRNRGGECFGNHDFYLRKGLNTKKLRKGNDIIFHINKNMCHIDQSLIIIQMSVIKNPEGN